MDVGGATRWTPAQVVSRREILDRLSRAFGTVEPLATESSAPAARFRLPSDQLVGVISSTSEPFCDTCDRSRLTADGVWYRCLYATAGQDLRGPLRAGASDDELQALIAATWSVREDQGAVDRLRLPDRKAFVPLTSLKSDPHLEMHTRGG
jgi:cyclic pyranopterin phosphate synthase